MFCKQCGNKIEDDWKVCPKCGQALAESEKTENKHIKSGNRKKIWIIIPIVVVVILLVVLGGNTEIDRVSETAKELVQKGAYGKYEIASIKEVMEYYWENGIWDSFVAEEGNNEMRIVEYAKDKERDSILQFKVNDALTEFELVHMKINGRAYTPEQAYEEIETIYQEYFKEKYPLDNLELADYIGKDIKTLLNDSKAFYKTDDDFEIYEDVSRNVVILVENDKIYTITIKENDNYTPMFASVKVGENINDIDNDKLEKMKYSQIPLVENSGMVLYGNIDTQEGVAFGCDENGKIVSISWANNLLELEKDYIEETQFIGVIGAYEPKSINDSFNGRIDFYKIDESTLKFEIYVFELGYNVRTGTAQIINSNAARYEREGFAINFTWTDETQLFVSSEGEDMSRDAGVIAILTDDVYYQWSVEFN